MPCWPGGIRRIFLGYPVSCVLFCSLSLLEICKVGSPGNQRQSKGQGIGIDVHVRVLWVACLMMVESLLQLIKLPLLQTAYSTVHLLLQELTEDNFTLTHSHVCPSISKFPSPPCKCDVTCRLQIWIRHVTSSIMYPHSVIVFWFIDSWLEIRDIF